MLRNAREVAREDCVDLAIRPGEVEALEHQADEVDCQRDGVDDEDGRVALVGLREQGNGDEEEKRCSQLSCVVD